MAEAASLLGCECGLRGCESARPRVATRSRAGSPPLPCLDPLIVDPHNKDFLVVDSYNKESLIVDSHNKESLIVDPYNKDFVFVDSYHGPEEGGECFFFKFCLIPSDIENVAVVRKRVTL